MAKLIIDPQKQLWPFVYKVIAKSPITGEYELERNRAVNRWIISVTRFDSIVVNEQAVDGDDIVSQGAFSMVTLHVKGGVVLKTPSDILEFLNS